MALLTVPRLTTRLLSLKLEYLLRRSRDLRLGDRGERGPSSSPVLTSSPKVLEEPLRRLLPLGLVTRRRETFLFVLLPLDAFSSLGVQNSPSIDRRSQKVGSASGLRKFIEWRRKRCQELNSVAGHNFP